MSKYHGKFKLTHASMGIIRFHLVTNIVFTGINSWKTVNNVSLLKQKEWLYQPHLSGIWSKDFLSSSSLIPITILQKPSW